MSLARKSSLLVITVWMLVFFTILSVALHRLVSPQITIAKRMEEITVSTYAAKAAVAYVQAKWQSASSVETGRPFTLTEINDKPLGDAGFSCKLFDESTKVNINTAPGQIIRALVGIDDKLAVSITNSKLRPFQAKEELLSLEGMTQEIYDGIKNIITVYGEGKVNVNTASEDVLRAFGMGDNLIAAIKTYRAGPDGQEGTEDDGLIKDVSQIGEILSAKAGLPPGDRSALDKLLNENLVSPDTTHLLLQIKTTFDGRPLSDYSVIIGKQEIYQWQE